MDKNNRISVRINGKDKPIEDKSNKELAAAKEEKDFNWVLPEGKRSPKVVSFYENQKQHKRRKKRPTVGAAPKLPLNRKKSTHKRWVRHKEKRVLPKKQWLSAFSAIVVGLVMGFIVLTMFTDETVKQTTANGFPDSEKQTETSPAKQAVAIPDLNFTLNIVQGAAFSTDGNAKSAVQTLKNSGYPAVLTHEESTVYLFIGAAMKEPKAKTLGKLYKQGQKTYVKKLQIQADPTHLNEDTRRFLGNGKKLLETLISSSVRGLTSKNPALTEKQWDNLEKSYQQWKTTANSKQIQSEAKALLNEVETAMATFKENQKNPSDSQLWQAQQTLLEAVLHYKNLVE